MNPSFRVAPAGAAQLASDPEARHIAWFEGDRERLQVATSAIGLGIDLTGAEARVVASERDLARLQLLLAELGSPYALPLDRFLRPIGNWQLRTRSLALDRPIIMGILNLTDDSFSGDGVGHDGGSALQRAAELQEAGADIIDTGAESARADRPVLEETAEAELVGRVVAELVREGHVVSSDTYKPLVARAALDAGAELVNDISGLTQGTGAAEAAAAAGAGYVLNFSFSAPKKRPDSPPMYGDIVAFTMGWMERRLAEVQSIGVRRESIVIDPGIAFGKSHDEDLQVIRRIGELRTFGQPVLLAHSRKNLFGSIGGRPPAERDLETHVASAIAYAQGVRIFRVHDAGGTRRALGVAAAISTAKTGEFASDASSWPWRAGAHSSHMMTMEPDKPAPEGQRW